MVDRRGIKEELGLVHKLLCRASANIGFQLVLRKFSRSEAQTALRQCEEAEVVLNRVIAVSDPRR